MINWSTLQIRNSLLVKGLILKKEKWVSWRNSGRNRIPSLLRLLILFLDILNSFEHKLVIVGLLLSKLLRDLIHLLINIQAGARGKESYRFRLKRAIKVSNNIFNLLKVCLEVVDIF